MSGNGQSSGGALGDTHPMELDHEACYRALSTRDARFDGRMFIGVHTTGSIADPSVRRERQNGRTLRSIPRRAQRRRLDSGLVSGAAPKVPQIWPPGEAHRTPFRAPWR